MVAPLWNGTCSRNGVRRKPILTVDSDEERKMAGDNHLKSLESMNAADVMTASPRSCSTFSTVLEAVMIFRDADCGAVPILEDGKPVAILTDRDVALSLTEFPDLVERPVGEIMMPGIVAVSPSDSLAHVCEMLRSQGVRRVVVVSDTGALVGIIGWADIAPVLSERMMGRIVMDVVMTS
jgi:CBS domain-containing protein